VRYPAEALKGKRAVVTLWGICLEGPICEAPVWEPLRPRPLVPRDAEEQAGRVQWQWPGVEWDVVVDPLAPEALVGA
jgi:hypothetical protein